MRCIARPITIDEPNGPDVNHLPLIRLKMRAPLAPVLRDGRRITETERFVVITEDGRKVGLLGCPARLDLPLLHSEPQSGQGP